MEDCHHQTGRQNKKELTTPGDFRTLSVLPGISRLVEHFIAQKYIYPAFSAPQLDELCIFVFLLHRATPVDNPQLSYMVNKLYKTRTPQRSIRISEFRFHCGCHNLHTPPRH